VPDPFCADVAELADAPAREAVGRKPVRVQLPPPAPLLSRRGWNSRHGGLKPRRTLRVRAGATPVAATNHAAVRGIEDRAVSKTAAPHGAWACKSPRPHQFIDGWWNEYTRVSETRGRKPVQVRILSRRPFSASSSSQQETRLSSGQRGCKSRRSDHLLPRSSK
jgi:hypothetical protein